MLADPDVLLHLFEVFEEVDGAIGRRSEPEVEIDDVVLRHYKLAHYNDSITFGI